MNPNNIKVLIRTIQFDHSTSIPGPIIKSKVPVFQIKSFLQQVAIITLALQKALNMVIPYRRLHILSCEFIDLYDLRFCLVC